MLLMLEKLTPTERAAYVLREAFDYPYEQIADIMQLSEPAAASSSAGRASTSPASGGARCRRRAAPPADRVPRRRATGDLEALEQFFAEDVVVYSDGGGMVRASKFPVLGAVTGREVRARVPHATSGTA